MDLSIEINSLEEKLNRIYMKLLRLKRSDNPNTELIEQLEEQYESLSDIIFNLEDLNGIN